MSGRAGGYDPAMTAPTNTTHYILTQNTAEPLTHVPWKHQQSLGFRDHVVDFYNKREEECPDISDPTNPIRHFRTKEEFYAKKEEDIIKGVVREDGGGWVMDSRKEWELGEHPHGLFCRKDCRENWTRQQQRYGRGKHWDCMWCSGRWPC